MLSAAFLLLCYFTLVLRSVPPEKFGWNDVVMQVLVLFAALVFVERIATGFAPSASPSATPA